MAVRTILIYDQCGEAPIRYTVLDGDLSRFDKVFINRASDDEALQEELSNLLYDEKTGTERVRWSDKFPKRFLLANPDAIIITCGFIP